MRVTRLLSDVPLPMRHFLGGVMVLGMVGGIAGLIVGLIVHPPTAWFALFEIGVPASIAGGILGLVSGVVTKGVHAVRHSRAN